MIRSVASLACRLALGLAALAVLAAATAMLAGPASARAPATGPACAVASLSVVAMSGVRAAAPEARRTMFDRAGIRAADIEAPADLGLPRPPTEAPAPVRSSAASPGHTSDDAPASASDGAPHAATRCLRRARPLSPARRIRWDCRDGPRRARPSFARSARQIRSGSDPAPLSPAPASPDA